MEFIQALGIYSLVAIALTWTTYITIYRPAIEILEGIIELKTSFSGIIGFIMYTIVGFIFAPILPLLIIANDNESLRIKLASELLSRYIDDE